jgi:serine/threonine-protein kinase
MGPTKDERRRETRALSTVLWMGMLAFTFLSIVILTIQSWAFMSGDKEETTVPNIVGLPTEAATLSVGQADLEFTIRSEVYTDEIKSGKIIDQSPAAGAKVKVGREVMVDVSLGSRTLKTPNVIGRLKAEAIGDLEEMGVTYSLTTQYSDMAPEGTIINQRPAPGAPIALGEVVDLVVADRPLNTMVQTPHLEGLPYDQAVAAISESGLALRQVRRVYQVGVDEVTVSTQYPLPGTRVRAGSEVILTLSCPTSYENVGQRSSRVSVDVPQSIGTVRVRIVVQDRYQTREVYSAEHTGPTKVEQLITSYGRTTVKVYFDNRIVREESF